MLGVLKIKDLINFQKDVVKLALVVDVKIHVLRHPGKSNKGAI